MLALDTNVLVYAHRQEFEQHAAALRLVQGLLDGGSAFGLPVFVVAEFLRVVTHPGVLRPPSRDADARAALDAVLDAPAARLLVPGARFWPLLREHVKAARLRGNSVFDAQIAAVCLERGIDVLVTEDRAFPRADGLRTSSIAAALPS